MDDSINDTTFDSGSPIQLLNSFDKLDFLDFIKKGDLDDIFINDKSSEYFDENNYILECTETEYNLKILSINIQSLNSKFHSLKCFLSNFPNKDSLPDILCLQEIWNIPVPEILKLEGYRFLYKQRNRQGGGRWLLCKRLFDRRYFARGIHIH